MEKIKWGVLGAGGIADRRTIPGMRLARNATLQSVMEIDANDAERLCEKHGAVKAYSSEEDLLGDPDVQAVYIASPVWLHGKQIKAAVAAGKHVLVEKPAALSCAEGKEVMRYSMGKGVMIAVGLMMRFGTYHVRMKELIAGGAIGQLVLARARFSCWYPDMPGAWRQDKSLSGGGSLMDLGIHCIDLIEYIASSRVKELFALCDTKSFKYGVEDSASLLMNLQNGANASIDVNFNIPDGASESCLAFYGTKGCIISQGTIGQVDEGHVEIYISDAGSYNAMQDGSPVSSGRLDLPTGNLYTKEIESFSDSILNGTPIAVPMVDGLWLQKIIEAAYESSEQGSKICLEEYDLFSRGLIRENR